MEKTIIEKTIDLVFEKDKIIIDRHNFVAFIEHRFMYGVLYEKTMVIRPIDHNRKWLLGYLQNIFTNNPLGEKPDLREVYNWDWDDGVQITFGELPTGWLPKEDY